MPRPQTLDRTAELAEDQWGLFTKRQAEASGMAWTTLSRLTVSGAAERIAHGIYRLRGAPAVDHLGLRAAWMQIDPDTPAWERGPESGVVSHRSAADFYGVGHLPADVHEFTVPRRRQSRRPDVRFHRGRLDDTEWIRLRGLPVTRPRRIAADLLAAQEDPEAVAQVIADALRAGADDPVGFVDAIAPHAARFGLRQGDGIALLTWLLDLTGDNKRGSWFDEARVSIAREASNDGGGVDG
jgi:Transcriptional regulator, AbiEi antitoxin